jgi:hypothetical protein
MVVAAQAHAVAYNRLRTALLARHFALGRHFRADLLSLENWLHLSPPVTSDHLSRLSVAERELLRWNVDTLDRDNPLLFGGQLLSCLAVESALGNRASWLPLRAAVIQLGRHYPFRGRYFEGYPLRWTAAASSHWDEERDAASGVCKPRLCRDFLADGRGGYDYAPSPSDPRWAPRLTVHPGGFVSPDEAKRREFWHNNFFDMYRRTEPSTDELCGLVAGYFMIARFARDQTAVRLVREQTTRLADYLAEYGYLLVRPTGGFTARGAAGALPALEWPFNMAFHAITGLPYPSRSDFKGACEKAGVWPALVGPITEAEAAVVMGIFSPGGIALGIALSPILAGLGLWATLRYLNPETPIFVNVLGRALGVATSNWVFDAFDGDQPQAGEFAIALIFHSWPTRGRFQVFMRTATLEKLEHARNFPPYLGLLALDDPDPTVRDAYLSWFTTRSRSDLDKEGQSSRTCLAQAVAVLLGAGPEEEKSLVWLLERYHHQLAGADPATADLTLVPDPDTGLIHESYQPALDYCTGVALAWLHASRRAAAGDPVTTPGFPVLPAGYQFTQPRVPPRVVTALRQGKLVLPRRDLLSSGFEEETRGVRLYQSASPRLPKVPAMVPPPREHLLYDLTVVVYEQDSDVFTGIVLREGDDYEIEASGAIWSGWLFGNEIGPEGDPSITWDPKFPLHAVIDPNHAHPYALLGRLNNYFYIGRHRARARWLYHSEQLLHLRINDNAPGNGSGSFSVRIRVWGEPAAAESLRFVDCIRRNPADPEHRIDAVSGPERGKGRWQLTPAEAVAEMKAGKRYFVYRPRLRPAEILLGQMVVLEQLHEPGDPPGPYWGYLTTLPECPS